MLDITTIDKAELEKDLADSRDDILACQTALDQGDLRYSGGSVQQRINDNRLFVRRITTELQRRDKL